MREDLHYHPDVIRKLNQVVTRIVTRLDRAITLMEVCGTHTHVIAEAGLRQILPDEVRLVSGPGCPVCVTPVEYLDRAVALGQKMEIILCTFGDLYRVPSSHSSLERAHAEGADIRIVYSPRETLRVARENPGKTVIFLAVGFETTVPAIAGMLQEAETGGLPNVKILPGVKVIPPALTLLAEDDAIQLDGLLLPGHVSVITGRKAYGFLSTVLPACIVGFTPADVMRGVLELSRMTVESKREVINLYGRAVTEEGNRSALGLIGRFFKPCDSRWRGFGVIPGSGLALKDQWEHRDAGRMSVSLPEPREPEGCRCGDILKGTIQPPECPLFGSSCTPSSPAGACMVSGEGTCAAWFRYRRYEA